MSAAVSFIVAWPMRSRATPRRAGTGTTANATANARRNVQFPQLPKIVILETCAMLYFFGFSRR